MKPIHIALASTPLIILGFWSEAPALIFLATAISAYHFGKVVAADEALHEKNQRKSTVTRL